MGQMTQPTVS